MANWKNTFSNVVNPYSVTVWTIIIDASITCPNCDQDMETIFVFKPINGKVSKYSRSGLQAAGFDAWLDLASRIEDWCPSCGYILPSAYNS